MIKKEKKINHIIKQKKFILIYNKIQIIIKNDI